ncbi:TolC family protein [Aporhodopirellula aestuarii]|uniref:TolC family protein n=1 Tax=Aporhodopirellula aestuarii TaxID=2950107 RepID=A0ABT0U8J8_9BACT|nr:TolC family protein [Aporhodopirellula aestuarii]MCM2372671.1 TolC family protein [Aporhodopirellula aestuarii]
MQPTIKSPSLLLTLGLAVGGCAGARHFAQTPVAEVTTQSSLVASADETRPNIVEPENNNSHALVAYQDDEAVVSSSDRLVSRNSESTLVATPFPEAGSLAIPANTIDLNLPSALAMVGGQHPVVGFAQWRVQEAYAQLARAEALWLPSIQTGFSFHRHDGNYQASDGSIVDVNRNSFQYGLGAGATGAGTTNTRPGIIAQFHLADAIFQPEIAEKTAWARSHAANSVLNEQLLQAALAYTELLNAHQDARILEETRDRTADLSRITADFAEAGEGLKSDAERMQTELILMDSRLNAAQERIAIASARLAQAISIDASNPIHPMDVTVIPLDLVGINADKASLIGTGLAARPELKESQALVAAACEAFKREKFAPFVPSVLLGYSTGGFGGGLGNDLSDVEGRYDFDAIMSWEVRNLGFGERAARRETAARVQQAKYEKLRVMDQVAREISEAYSQVEFRRQQISITQQAIETAQKSYESNLDRIRDGEGLPIEVLQAVQALQAARQAYLQSVVEHNQAQFRLQWALGWPVSA